MQNGVKSKTSLKASLTQRYIACLESRLLKASYFLTWQPQKSYTKIKVHKIRWNHNETEWKKPMKYFKTLKIVSLLILKATWRLAV